MTPSQVARTLTKAQQDWLISPGYVDPNSIRSLRRKGIVGERQRVLTPLGLAVRQYLKENRE